MKNTFNPNYAISPIEILYDMGVTELKESDRITQEIADKLESLLGIPASFWLELENQYQKDLVRLNDDE